MSQHQPLNQANIIIGTSPNIAVIRGPLGATTEELEKVEKMVAYDPQIQMWVLDGKLESNRLNILIINKPAPTNHKWSRWD